MTTANDLARFAADSPALSTVRANLERRATAELAAGHFSARHAHLDWLMLPDLASRYVREHDACGIVGDRCDGHLKHAFLQSTRRAAARILAREWMRANCPELLEDRDATLQP